MMSIKCYTYMSYLIIKTTNKINVVRNLEQNSYFIHLLPNIHVCLCVWSNACKPHLDQ